MKSYVVMHRTFLTLTIFTTIGAGAVSLAQHSGKGQVKVTQLSHRDIIEKLDGKVASATVNEVTLEPGQADRPHRHAGPEPAIADIFDVEEVQAVVRRAQPEIVIEQLTALPRTYTRESMRAAAALNRRIRLEGGANVMAAAQAAGVRRYLRQSVAFFAVPGPGLADEETPLAMDASPAVAADSRLMSEIEHSLLENPKLEGIVLRYGFFYGPGTWFNDDGDVASSSARIG